jgi:hypothetical protein
VRNEVFLIHADAGIGDSQNLVGLIQLEVDAWCVDTITDDGLVPVLSQSKVAQFIERIGGIGNEFAEEDFRVRVERMDDQLEKLAYFCLELLFGHGISDYSERAENPQPGAIDPRKESPSGA